MPAIPVPQKKQSLPEEFARHIGKQGIFERGDRVFITTPVQVFKPTSDQIEEFAFSKQLKTNAPNENLVWFRGSYVEAGNANANGAQWSADELKVKSLTPMLMPVTVMHDPRTAVGTIADTKLIAGADSQRSKIDTVLALWAHRFPDAVAEAQTNAEAGTLMQSMECYSPWYECSECAEVFHKLPDGAERAQWCDHLKASNPSGGVSDWDGGPRGQEGNASRILGDVCFTGTGLIFGTRGARGAYDDAQLTSFEDEVARHHSVTHSSTASTTPRRTPKMGLVQIEDSELAVLRKERDDARTDAAKFKAEAEKVPDLQRAAETAEAAKAAAETERDTFKAEKIALEEKANQTTLKDQRFAALGSAFKAKLEGMPTAKANLESQATTLDDAAWDTRLKELEETTAVKRDADDGSPTPPAGGGGGGGSATATDFFSKEEVASAGAQLAPTGPSEIERSGTVGSLAGAFRKGKAA